MFSDFLDVVENVTNRRFVSSGPAPAGNYTITMVRESGVEHQGFFYLFPGIGLLETCNVALGLKAIG